MAKSVVTLYIDDTSIRLLEAQGNRVEKWAHLLLEPGLVSDGTIVDEAEIATKISELLKAQSITTKKVVAGLSGLHCLTRPITLPKLPKAVLAEAVRREAEGILPVPLEQLYISWQIIDTSEEEIQVFLAASPRNAADALIKTLRQAGLDPYLLDLKPLALARVVNKATAIIVDLQPTELEIVIMVDGIPQPVRCLSIPSKLTTLSEKLPIIREDVDRTIKFYNSSHSEKPLDPSTPIFVSGELEQELEACQSLASELNYPVLPLPPPLECPDDLAPSQYMVNIGLALKEIALPEIAANLSVVNLNVLPEAYKPKPVSSILFKLVKTLIAPIIILIAIGLLFPLVTRIQNTAADTISLQAQLDATNHLIQQRLTKQQSQKEEITELETKVSEVEAPRDTFTAAVDYIEEQRYVVNSDLEIVTSALLGTIDLSDVSHASNSLTISGMATSEAEILAYAKRLRAGNWFSQVIITISSIVKDEDGISFTLTVKAGG